MCLPNFYKLFTPFIRYSFAWHATLLDAMKVNELLLPHYDQEVQNTRRILQVVPMDKFSWKPHEKSTSLGRLASHVAELPNFLTTIIQTDGMDLATADMKPFLPSTREELLAGFEDRAKEARQAIASASEEHLAKPWRLTWKGQEVFGGVRNLLLQTRSVTKCIIVRNLPCICDKTTLCFPGFMARLRMKWQRSSSNAFAVACGSSQRKLPV